MSGSLALHWATFTNTSGTSGVVQLGGLSGGVDPQLVPNMVDPVSKSSSKQNESNNVEQKN